ncbi:augurin-A [Spinachia spinachia]
MQSASFHRQTTHESSLRRGGTSSRSAQARRWTTFHPRRQVSTRKVAALPFASLLHSCCSVRTQSGCKMASQRLWVRFLGLAVMLTFVAFRDASSNSSLLRIFNRGDVAGAASAPPRGSVAVASSKALEFLGKTRRPKRNLWDRSRPDVQQWIAQFMSMGFDEQRLEADLSYWMDQARSRDQGRQHQYDENAPIGPRDHSSYRHGANVNYDYY